MLTLPRPRLLLDQFAMGGLGNCATPGSTPCCGCVTNICVSAVCPSATISLQGATINIAGVGSCTTNSSGCCQFSSWTTGSYSITVVYQGVTVFSGTRTITACHTNNIVITSVPSGFICCGNCLIPTTLFVTDANGTHTAPWTGSTWNVCYSKTVTGVTLSGPSGCGCLCSAAGPISLPIAYTLSCAPSPAVNSLQIGVEWTCACCVGVAGCNCSASVGCLASTGIFQYFAPSNGCTVFGSGFVADCNICVGGASNPSFDGVSVTQAWSQCDPFTLSATLPGTGNFTANPVGTSISISS